MRNSFWFHFANNMQWVPLLLGVLLCFGLLFYIMLVVDNGVIQRHVKPIAGLAALAFVAFMAFVTLRSYAEANAPTPAAERAP